MKRDLFNHQSKYLDWLLNERYQISVSIFTALLPSVIAAIFSSGKSDGGHRNGSVLDWLKHLHEMFFTNNSLFQAIFVLAALIILIYYRWETNDQLSNNKGLITNYIERNTNRRIRRCNEKDFAFEAVSNITRQFYNAWIIVWALWLVYYLSDYVIFRLNREVCVSREVLKYSFDFATSIVMYIIYIILSNFTTKHEQHTQNNHSLWYHSIFLGVLSSFFLAFVFTIGNSWCWDARDIANQHVSLLVSAFSTMSFVLVLGKMNSNYLQIPWLFLLVMYVYALIQAYIPFSNCEGDMKDVGKIIEIAIPYVTLIGKVFVMLTLCWVVDKKRLIFFVIHRSAAMDETPVLLKDLDNEPVEF